MSSDIVINYNLINDFLFFFKLWDVVSLEISIVLSHQLSVGRTAERNRNF